MTQTKTVAEGSRGADRYRLEAQVGFLLRRASQRHISIFSDLIPELTPTQFAVIAKAYEMESASQAELGRATALDGATIKGVIDRLQMRGLIETSASTLDRRRMVVRLSAEGARLFATLVLRAEEATAQTLAPLNADERIMLLKILDKIG